MTCLRVTSWLVSPLPRSLGTLIPRGRWTLQCRVRLAAASGGSGPSRSCREGSEIKPLEVSWRRHQPRHDYTENPPPVHPTPAAEPGDVASSDAFHSGGFIHASQIAAGSGVVGVRMRDARRVRLGRSGIPGLR